MRYDGWLLTILILMSCGPPQPSDESDSDAVDELTQACQAYCEIAILCSTDEFAKYWKFQTVSECVDDCMTFTQSAIDLVEKPECETILSEEWACAGEITQCEYFESFEDDAHGLPGLVENPCRPELELALDECN
jgi:hypothetical protein